MAKSNPAGFDQRFLQISWGFPGWNPPWQNLAGKTWAEWHDWELHRLWQESAHPINTFKDFRNRPTYDACPKWGWPPNPMVNDITHFIHSIRFLVFRNGVTWGFHHFETTWLVVASWLPVGQKSEAREDGRPEISMLAILSDDLDHTSTCFAPPLFPHGDINWNSPYFGKALDPRIIPFARCGWKRDLKQICSLRRTICNRQLDLEISVRKTRNIIMNYTQVLKAKCHTIPIFGVWNWVHHSRCNMVTEMISYWVYLGVPHYP